VNEETDHLECFRDLGLVVREYTVENAPHLRALTLARPDYPAVKDALALYRNIISELTEAYATGRVEDRAAIIQARDGMTKLNDVADGLCGRGVGIPFFYLSLAVPNRLAFSACCGRRFGSYSSRLAKTTGCLTHGADSV
jgi:hypothetical protein